MRHNFASLALGLILTSALAGTIIDPIAVLAQSSRSDLPDIGSPGGTVASVDEEYQIGRMVLRDMREANALIEDAESAEYVQSLGLRLAAQTPDSTRQFHYLLLNEGELNAEATPGGFIFLNYGTVLAANSESELAGVLAHETAHVVQRHLVRGALAQRRQSITTAAALLGAILLGAMSRSPGAIEGGVLAAEGMGAQLQINFTRDQEYEADRVGMGFLAAAGFDPLGMPDFFEDLSRRYGSEASMIPRMLLDHPVTSDRIAEARNRAAQLPRPTKPYADSLSFGLIQERLRVLTASENFDLRAYYERRMAVVDPPLSVRYGLALALVQRDHPAEAVKLLKPLVAAHQNVILLYSLLGQAQMAAAQNQEGLETFARAEILFPRNVPLTVRYGEALIKAGRPRQAHELLLDLFNNVEPTPAQIRLTALAASASGNDSEAYYYMGEYDIAYGELPLATQQLELALAAPNSTVVQKKRYQARLDEIRDVLARDRREHGRTAENSGG